jgi:hypothetical protein
MKPWFLALLIILGGCREQQSAPTAEQSDQLNNAEGMLDEQGDNQP